MGTPIVAVKQKFMSPRLANSFSVLCMYIRPHRCRAALILERNSLWINYPKYLIKFLRDQESQNTDKSCFIWRAEINLARMLTGSKQMRKVTISHPSPPNIHSEKPNWLYNLSIIRNHASNFLQYFVLILPCPPAAMQYQLSLLSRPEDVVCHMLKMTRHAPLNADSIKYLCYSSF